MRMMISTNQTRFRSLMWMERLPAICILKRTASWCKSVRRLSKVRPLGPVDQPGERAHESICTLWFWIIWTPRNGRHFRLHLRMLKRNSRSVRVEVIGHYPDSRRISGLVGFGTVCRFRFVVFGSQTFPITYMASRVGFSLPPKGSKVMANAAAPEMSFILYRPERARSNRPASTGFPSTMAHN